MTGAMLSMTHIVQNGIYIHACIRCVHVSMHSAPDGFTSDLPSLPGYPVDYWVFLTPSTGLLGGRTFLMVLNKITLFVFNFFVDLDFFFVDSLSDNRLAVACN